MAGKKDGAIRLYAVAILEPAQLPAGVAFAVPVGRIPGSSVALAKQGEALMAAVGDGARVRLWQVQPSAPFLQRAEFATGEPVDNVLAAGGAWVVTVAINTGAGVNWFEFDPVARDLRYQRFSTTGPVKAIAHAKDATRLLTPSGVWQATDAGWEALPTAGLPASPELCGFADTDGERLLCPTGERLALPQVYGLVGDRWEAAPCVQ